MSNQERCGLLRESGEVSGHARWLVGCGLVIGNLLAVSLGLNLLLGSRSLCHLVFNYYSWLWRRWRRLLQNSTVSLPSHASGGIENPRRCRQCRADLLSFLGSLVAHMYRMRLVNLRAVWHPVSGRVPGFNRARMQLACRCYLAGARLRVLGSLSAASGALESCLTIPARSGRFERTPQRGLRVSGMPKRQALTFLVVGSSGTSPSSLGDTGICLPLDRCRP